MQCIRLNYVILKQNWFCCSFPSLNTFSILLLSHFYHSLRYLSSVVLALVLCFLLPLAPFCGPIYFYNLCLPNPNSPSSLQFNLIFFFSSEYNFTVCAQCHYLFIHGWKSMLLSLPCYCEWSHNKQG